MKLITAIFINAMLFASSLSFAAKEIPVSREKVQFSHRVNFEDPQDLNDKGASQVSRVYYHEVSGEDLNAGVEIVTDAENAIVQLSAIPDAGVGTKSFSPALPVDLELSKGDSRRSVEDRSIRMERSTQMLRNVAPKMFRHSRVMRMPSDMGRGRFKLKAKTPAREKDRYMMYVVDRDSDIELNVKSRRSSYSRGEMLNFDAEVKSSKNVQVLNMNSTLLAPDGRRFPITTGKREKNKLNADWKLDIDTKRDAGGLWELEVESTILNDEQVPMKRIAKIAIDIHETTAELKTIKTKNNTLRLKLNVEQAGRFEIRALVAGTDVDNQLKPITLSYHAEWLEQGQQKIEVAIDQQLLEHSELSAPFIIQSVQLLDQSRMSALETREGKWKI